MAILADYRCPLKSVHSANDLQYNDCSSLTLRERLLTHKVFTKYQCFYLNYHKFSIKSYVLDVY